MPMGYNVQMAENTLFPRIFRRLGGVAERPIAPVLKAELAHFSTCPSSKQISCKSLFLHCLRNKNGSLRLSILQTKSGSFRANPVMKPVGNPTNKKCNRLRRMLAECLGVGLDLTGFSNRCFSPPTPSASI